MTDSDVDALTWKFLSGAALVVHELSSRIRSPARATIKTPLDILGYTRIGRLRPVEIRHDHASQMICTRIRAEAVPISGPMDDPGFEVLRPFTTSVVCRPISHPPEWCGGLAMFIVDPSRVPCRSARGMRSASGSAEKAGGDRESR
jgi:hypothetical protein